MSFNSPIASALLALVAFAAALPAQEGDRPARTVISIGNYPRVDGLRINFRNRDLDLVRGINLTLWQPYDDDFSGTVKGAAVGLPMTGVGSVKGIGAGLFGVAASDNMTGLVIGGVGADGDCRGIGIGGVGVGAGGTLRGIMVAGIGVGAEEMRGLALAPVLFRTERGGRLIGGSISAVNAVRGEQRGITVGVVNYARSLQGAQLGIVNVVRDNPRGRRVLPILNWGRDR